MNNKCSLAQKKECKDVLAAPSIISDFLVLLKIYTVIFISNSLHLYMALFFRSFISIYMYDVIFIISANLTKV